MKKILIFTLLFLFIPVIVFGKTVTSTGEGPSESLALKSAMRLAVEQAFGTYIESNTVTENYIVIKDVINSHAEGYIVGYEIIEKSENRGLYRVSIKADVRDDISNIILSDAKKRAKIKSALKDPRIAVRAHTSKGVHSEIVRNAFMVGLRKIGFSRIVNDKDNADFLVTVIINENKTGAFGANFTLSAEVTKTKTAEAVFFGSESGMGAGTVGKQRAIRRATEKLLNKIDLRIMELAMTPEKHITLIMTNKVPNILSMQNFLSELSGITGIYLRKAKANAVEFDLDYLGDANDFAMLLQTKGISVKSIEGDVVKI